MRQRNNPTAEQLREHRLKHDEMMRAKQEESRRSMAEAAAANARALKKVSQVSGAEAGAPSGDLTPVAHDDVAPAADASNNVKRKKKKVAGAAAAGIASKRSVYDESEGTAPISSQENEMPAASRRSPSKNLSSPKKTREYIAHRSSSHQDRETGGRTLFQDEDNDSPSQGHSSPVRNTAKRAQEGSKLLPAGAVDLPDLTTVESVAAFCAPDWLLAFGRVDLDEVNNDIEVNNKQSFAYVHMMLQPPPPSLDAQNLMKRNV